MHLARILAIIAVASSLAGSPSQAMDKVRAGTAVWPIWAFLPLQIGAWTRRAA